MRNFEYEAVITIVVLSLLLAGCTNVQTVNAQTMLVTFSSNYPALWRLTSAAAYIFGVGFMMRGIYTFRQYGQGMSMMSQQSSIKAPVIYVFVGAALMYLPTMKSSLLVSSFGTAQQSPLAYNIQSSLLDAQSMYALLGFVQIVGLIAFVRGWVMLSNSASPSGQSQFGKALTHIIGGLFAINIQGTINMLEFTFGIS